MAAILQSFFFSKCMDFLSELKEAKDWMSRLKKTQKASKWNQENQVINDL